MRRAKDPDHDAVMRIGSKLRGGGPILHNGIKAVGFAGTPPPRTVIGDRVARCGQRRNRQVFLSEAFLPSVCRTKDDALGQHAIAYEVPQGNEQLARQGDDHLLARGAGVVGAQPAARDTIEEDARDIATLLGDGAHLVGHSYGPSMNRRPSVC
jgi:hypothetical protein